MRPRVFPAEDGTCRWRPRHEQPASMRPRVFPAEDGRRPRAVDTLQRHASMRPRVFPAEDKTEYCAAPGWVLVRFNEAAGIPRGRPKRRTWYSYPRPSASMRPRVFPAEDGHAPRVAVLDRLASMRPRVFPAEDLRPAPLRPPRPAGASMRPRVFPAEDGGSTRAWRKFRKASMRPRVFPAEDLPCPTENCIGVLMLQ